jgi:hypothetical protein
VRELTATRAAQIVDDHEVMLDAAVGSAVHAIEHLHNRSDRHLETGFFEYLARDRILERLAELHATAREAPLAFERFMTALDEQNALAVEDDSSDAHDWTGWWFATLHVTRPSL